MSFLSFLGAVKVANPDVKEGRSTSKKQRNPNALLLAIRLWADGSVYPSQALVDKFNLEYPKATVSVVKTKDGKDKNVYTVVDDKSNGLDIIDTAQWPQIVTPEHFLAVAVSPKDSPKLDLFSVTRYDETGNPIASVMEQGSATYGKSVLLDLVKDRYNVEPNEEGFIDLEVVMQAPDGTPINLSSANGINLLPKVIARGADKGKPDYSRRENVNIYVLAPMAVLEDNTTMSGAADLAPTAMAEAELS